MLSARIATRAKFIIWQGIDAPTPMEDNKATPVSFAGIFRTD